MSRFLIQERVQTPDELKGFALEGYSYDDTLSDGDILVFARPESARS